MDIIIVGAGIAGLGAGIALRRAGHKVTSKILEQSSLLQEVGAAIMIKPNAWRVLESRDFVPEQSSMVAIRNGSMSDGTNMEVLNPHFWKDFESTGIPMYAVHRVDLHNQLRVLATQKEGPGRPCDIQVRSKVVDYDATNGQVTTKNGEILHADLIIAADGVHSTAVKHVSDEAVQTGNTSWAIIRWLVPTEDIRSDPETAHMIQDSSVRYFAVANGAAALLWYPCRNNEVENFGYLSREFDTSSVGEDFRGAIEPSTLLKYAEKHFAPILQTVIKKARDVKFWKLISRDPIPKWHKNRLLLIGDAAHPMLTFRGQGGNQAIEDGAALGVLFDQIDDKGVIEDRLQLFEQVRRNRGSALQVLSSTNPPTPESVLDAAAKFLPNGKRLDTAEEVDEYVLSFDVIGESKAALAASL